MARRDATVVPTARTAAAMASLKDGMVYVWGGYSQIVLVSQLAFVLRDLDYHAKVAASDVREL